MIQKHRFKVDKLVRDKLPDILRSNGIAVFDRVMEQGEYIKRLKEKLVEEAKEVEDVKSPLNIKEELADVLEVVHALSTAYHLSYQDIEDTRLKKKEEKGGLEGRTYAAFVEMPSNHRSIGYYLERPKHYPEVDG